MLLLVVKVGKKLKQSVNDQSQQHAHIVAVIWFNTQGIYANIILHVGKKFVAVLVQDLVVENQDGMMASIVIVRGSLHMCFGVVITIN